MQLYTLVRDLQESNSSGSEGSSLHDAEMAASRSLLDAAQACEGFSGRMLRKLPFLAHAGGRALCPINLTASMMPPILHELHQSHDGESLRIDMLASIAMKRGEV